MKKSSSVPLVLAVEPDLRQGALLKRVIGDGVYAELIVVDSRDAAIAALNARVPDVILLTALLSPRDEAEMVAHLRTLEGADHVQTHTIPQLASGSTERAEAPAAQGRLLGKFRRKKEAQEPISGCDPALFADEVRAFLARAAELKGHAASAPHALERGQKSAKKRSTAQHEDAITPASDGTGETAAGSAWSAPFEWRKAEPISEPAPKTTRPSLVTSAPLAVIAEEEEERRAAMEAERTRALEGRAAAKAAAERDEAKATAEAAAKREDERKRLEAVAAAKREDERKRLEAEAAAKREDERKRLEAVAAAKREDERKRLEAEAAAKREDERKRLEAEAAAKREDERKRLEAEAAAKREDERKRLEAEAAAKREDERKRLEAEAAAKREDERKRLEAVAAAKREDERKRLEAVAAAKREDERKRLEAVAAALREIERLRIEAEAAAELTRIEAAAAAQVEREQREAAAKQQQQLEAEAAERRDQERVAREQLERAAADRAAEPDPDAFADFREDIPSILSLMPLAHWAKREESNPPAPAARDADDLRELIEGLALPPHVAGVSYARGCRIRRVRVAASGAPPRAKGPVIVSRRALDELRAGN